MKGLFAAIAAAALSSTSFGGVSTFESFNLAAEPTISENASAGKVSHLKTTYDSASKAFTWDVTFSNGVAKDTDGFWLVVGPGPNPKGHQYEYAIMYFDGRTIGNPAVTIYRYNGQNNSDSWSSPGDLLASSKIGGQTTITGLSATETAGTRTFKFNVNAAGINSAFAPPPPQAVDWKGIQFGDKIGFWFHPVDGLSTSYNSNGGLTKFSYAANGWDDSENTPTPAPASAALLGLGGLIVARRRR